jgi:Flp pilus assembly protein TadG
MTPRLGSLDRRRDDGSTAVELVLLTPLLMFVIFVVVQAALYMHARHVVLAAAQQGARLARTAAPNDQTAADSARAGTFSYLHQLGADIVSDPNVTVTRASGQATVRVTAHAVSIMPGVTLQVVETSSGPVEMFRAP